MTTIVPSPPRFASPSSTRTMIVWSPHRRVDAREEQLDQLLAQRGHRGRGAGNRAHRRGTRPVSHVLRTRPRPDPALDVISPTLGQDPGLRLPRRPHAHPPDPRARGRPSRHQRRARDGAERGADRGDRPRSRLRTRTRGSRQRRGARPLSSRAASTTRPWGADVSLATLNLCRETLDGIRNHSWSRPAPADPRGRSGQLGRPYRLRVPRLRGRRFGGHREFRRPARCWCASRCGSSRRQQLGTFINAMIATTRASGVIGMDARHAEALAAFRAFNYDSIYMRDASRLQAQRSWGCCAPSSSTTRRTPSSCPTTRGPPSIWRIRPRALSAAVELRRRV